MGRSGQRHAPAALTPSNSPGTHRRGGWVGPKAGYDDCGKKRKKNKCLKQRYIILGLPGYDVV